MATPVFCCGAECGVSGSTAHWVFDSANCTFSTSTVRSGARSLRINRSDSTTGRITSLGLTSSSIWVVRFYIRFATLPTSSVQLLANGLNNFGVCFRNADNTIRAGNRTFSASTGAVVTTGQWYRIDAKMDLTGATQTFDVSVDGVALEQATNAASGAATTINFGEATGVSQTYDAFFDDIIISNTSGDYPIGPGKVEHFVPTADGTHNIAGTNDFERGSVGGVDILNATTDAYQLVDDVPLQSGAPGTTDFINMIAPPNATDYVECVFGPAPGISPAPRAPRAVEVIAGIAQAATGAGNMEIRINDNGTMDAMYSATAVAGVTTIEYKRKHYATGPAGAWVIGGGGNGDFTDLRVRFGSPAALDVNPDQYFTSIMIEAEFEGETDADVLSAIHRNIEQPDFTKPKLSNSLRSLLAGSFFMDNFPIPPPEDITQDKWFQPAQQPYFGRVLINPYGQRGVSTFAFDSDALAFIFAAGITNKIQRTLINNLVIAAKDHGWWAKCLAIYPVVGGTAVTHAVNLKSPGTFDITFVGAYTHNSSGMRPNAGASRGETGLVPSTALTLNDTHISVYSRTNVGDFGYDMGIVIGANQRISMHVKYTDTNFYGDQYSASQRTSYSNSDSLGYYLDTRTSSTNHVAYKNGVAQHTNSTENTGTLPTSGIQIGNADAANSVNRVGAFYTIGSSIDATMALAMYNDIQNFQIGLGRQV